MQHCLAYNISDYEEKWPIYGFLNYCTIMKLKVYSLQLGKWDKVSFVQMSVHYTMLQSLSFKQLQDVLANLGTFSCQILSLSIVLPSIEENKN